MEKYTTNANINNKISMAKLKTENGKKILL